MAAHKVVFLFDVDNTLIENDRVTADLRHHLEQTVGHEGHKHYFEIFEEIRSELGYADYLGALQRYRTENPHNPNLLEVSYFLSNYPFANRLFPNALDAIEHCQQMGRSVILSDGDVVFQPRKVDRSGLLEAFEKNVMIFIHKELELDAVKERYPAGHYVMIDDKLRILASIKKAWGNKVTTVFPRQGHYATDPKAFKDYPPADISIERIGNLIEYDLSTLIDAGRGK